MTHPLGQIVEAFDAAQVQHGREQMTDFPDVGMRIVETGHERAAGEIDPARGRAGLSQDGVGVADNGNSTRADTDGVRHRRHRLRENVTVV